MEALAASNLLLWMPVLSSAIAHAIATVGPDAARERWLERSRRARRFLALAVTEPQCGHNVFRSEATVCRDGERFMINGLKARHLGHRPRRARARAWARRRASGSRARRRGSRPCSSTRAHPASSATSCRCAGARACASASSSFEDVEAPLDALVGVEGQGLLDAVAVHPRRAAADGGAVDRQRPLLPLARAGAREGALDLRPAADRRRAGDPAPARPPARAHRGDAAARLPRRRALRRRTPTSWRWRARRTWRSCSAPSSCSTPPTTPMQTLGRAAWDEREGMIDLYLDARAGALGADLPGARAQLRRPARARPAQPPLSARHVAATAATARATPSTSAENPRWPARPREYGGESERRQIECASGDLRQGPAQVLRRSRGRPRHRPRGSPRRGVRVPGAERRRQDDDGRDPGGLPRRATRVM